MLTVASEALKIPLAFEMHLKHYVHPFQWLQMVCKTPTAWKVSKYGVTYFPVFSPNIGKYGPDKIP